VGLIRPKLFNFFKNILAGQKRDVTELKLLWPVNMTGHGSKIILSPVIYWTRKIHNKLHLGPKIAFDNVHTTRDDLL